jgi:hypothetical protein
MFSGVASCTAAPVERVFALIKSRFSKNCEIRMRKVMSLIANRVTKKFKQKEIIEEIVKAISEVSEQTIKKIFPQMLKKLDLYLVDE